MLRTVNRDLRTVKREGAQWDQHDLLDNRHGEVSRKNRPRIP